MSTAETERHQQRRMKLLADSQKRMNRIISGNGESGPSPDDCDSAPKAPASSSDGEQPAQVSTASAAKGAPCNGPAGCPPASVPEQQQSPPSSKLPPRECEPFPRKVSLISSPIHYKTLQLSKQYNSMLNHPNIVNNLRCNTSAKFMLLLIVLAFMSSLFNANIPMLFISYLLMKHAYNGFYRNVWFDINVGVVKELFTFLFSYIITHVTLRVVSS